MEGGLKGRREREGREAVIEPMSRSDESQLRLLMDWGKREREENEPG